MAVLSKSIYVLAVVESLIVSIVSLASYGMVLNTYLQLFCITLLMLGAIFLILSAKGYYKLRTYSFKDLFIIFESIFIGAFIAGILAAPLLKGIAISLIIADIVIIYVGFLFTRTCYFLYKKFFKQIKNVLIVGAGQDGKLIAKEIQSRPELGMKVVGFLDDNMNRIEEEDATIPILGLTYDSEAVIKDNKVDDVIIAVKSRMDSNILTDLAKGIPMGVKVWRMPTIYSYITKKLFPSKMAVNWLFYDYVRPKHILYSKIKRIIDIIAALVILIVTLPVTLIAVFGIKFSDFGTIFYAQTRIGKFGKPFKMFKLRTMYQDKVQDDFDDDLVEVVSDDKRIMPFCKWIRKFHVDDIPQMFNILKGDMSLVGPRPIREDVDIENCEKFPFWQCRSWVRPGLTGWQQISAENCSAEDRLGYDLYYVKHRTVLWEFTMFVQYVAKIITGKCN